MKHKLAIFAPLLLLSLAAACQKERTPSPSAWAVVNGTEITRAEVEKYYRSRLHPEQPGIPAPQPSQEEALSLKLSVLDELISNEILLEQAAKLNLLATDGEVEDKFTESKSPYTEEEFQKKLKDSGLTVEDLKNELRRQLSIQKLLNREVVAKISITDQDVTDFYGKNRAQFNVAEPNYHLAQIVVTPHPDPQVHNRKNDDAKTDAEARQKIASLAQRLASGEDFAQVASNFSEDPSAANGGDLGFVPESALNSSDPQLKKIVLSLRAGEFTKPISTREGYRILKLISREPAGQRQISDPQVQQSIRETLRNRKEQLLRAAYLAVLRDQSKVTNYLAQQVLESAGKLPGSPANSPKP